MPPKLFLGVSALVPKVMCYEYILFTYHTLDRGIWFLRECRDVIKEVIIDTGVFKFFEKLGLKDYPVWFLSRYVRALLKVRNLFSHEFHIYYVIPDIPVDYEGRASLYPWNVKRTIEYIKYFLRWYVNELKPLEPIAPVQGGPKPDATPAKVFRKHYEIYSKFYYLALAPTCSTKLLHRLADMIETFDKEVDRPYHAFGVHVRVFDILKLRKIIWFRSFDTSSYSNPKYLTNLKLPPKYKNAVRALDLIRKCREKGIEVGKYEVRDDKVLQYLKQLKT